MIHLTNIKDIEQAIADNHLCLFYIKVPDCGVCNVMLDKVERLADSITAVYSFYTDITEEPLIAGQFLVYSYDDGFHDDFNVSEELNIEYYD